MYARHTFLRLNRDAAPMDLCGSQEALQSWLADMPIAIVRSFRDGDDRETIPVGSALPTAQNRARIGYAVAPDAIAEVIGRFPLADALSVAPDTWQDKLRQLVDGMLENDLIPFTYGSLAWEYLTGYGYIRETSDLDIAVKIADRNDLERALSLLRKVDRVPGPAIDGEIVWPDEAAVNWRELNGAEEHVLVKSPDGAALRTRASLMERLET